ncbi:7808_t:CDS:2 [Entrophospora sp. SA101]|nr:7808_t:CDS:2 [Entrophospora sp. SA101]
MKKAHNGHLEKFAVVHITKNIQKDELRAWAKQWLRNKTCLLQKEENITRYKAYGIGSYMRSNEFDITPKNLCEHVNCLI